MKLTRPSDRAWRRSSHATCCGASEADSRNSRDGRSLKQSSRGFRQSERQVEKKEEHAASHLHFASHRAGSPLDLLDLVLALLGRPYWAMVSNPPARAGAATALAAAAAGVVAIRVHCKAHRERHLVRIHPRAGCRNLSSASCGSAVPRRALMVGCGVTVVRVDDREAADPRVDIEDLPTLAIASGFFPKRETLGRPVNDAFGDLYAPRGWKRIRSHLAQEWKRKGRKQNESPSNFSHASLDSRTVALDQITCKNM